MSSVKSEKFINPAKIDALPPLPLPWVERMAEERGWTPEAIAEADLRLFKPEFGPERIAFPIPDGEGRHPNVRLYLPKAKGKQLKMINWYEGSGENKVTFGGDLLWPPAVLWVDGPVWLVEGEPDRVAGLSHRLPGNVVTRTGGARSWKDEWTELFRGRDVIICLDADKTGLAGAERVADEISGVANSVLVIIWPAIMYQGTQHPLFGQNKVLADYSPIVQEFGPEYPENHGEDLTDFFHKHGKSLQDLMDLVETAVEVSLPIEVIPADGLAPAPPVDPQGETVEGEEDNSPERMAILRMFFKWQSGWKFKPSLLRDEIIRQRQFMADPLTKQFYEWEGRYWKGSSIEFVESWAADLLGIEAESARVANAGRLVYLKSLLPKDRALNDHHDLICFANGMLDVSEGENWGMFHPHEPGYYSTQMLPYDFDDDAECPIWNRVLDDYRLSPAAQLQIQQFFGYCFTRETKYAKCLLLKGDGSDGKSVILKILQAMIGEENCSAVQMSRLEDPFERATLYGKLLNISTEENKGVFGSAFFKAIVTGDMINASFKHKDVFQFRSYAKCAFASNFFPNVGDNSDGFFRRILPVKFTRQFLEESQQDKNLEQKLLGELPGIAAWALAGLVALRKHDGFVKSDESIEFLQEYRSHNNPVLSFVQERCRLPESDEDLRTSVDDLYRAYATFCKQYGYKPLQRGNFGETLRQIARVKQGRLLKTQCITNEDDEKKRPRAYLGIELLQEFCVAAPAPPSAAGGSYRDD